MDNSTSCSHKTHLLLRKPMLGRLMRKIILFLLLFVVTEMAKGQCTVYDGQGNASNNPVWVSCSGGAFTLYVQSPNAFGALTIDWGDGSPNTVVASLVPPAFISHAYAAAINNFNVTITETATGCVINGLVVMEEPVNASIQIPIGGVTQTCAPDDLIFTNSSTDVSQNTEFTWDFGDGSPIQVFGPGNAGQTITHTYQQGTVNCVTQVTLTAENYCSFGNPTVATFNPIQIYDIDEAQITADNVLLCYPDTVVHFDNTTAKNCVPQGNTAQRFEYWNFGDYWGVGQDSIIDWTPFDPPAKPGYDIAFPGIGTYTIMMADSNMCGPDTTFITVQIVDAPTAALAANVDSACAGDLVTFTNGSFGGNQTLINYGDGGGFQAIGASATHAFNSAGNYEVILVTNIVGGTNSCTDTATLDVVILPSPVASANLAPAGGCDSVLVSFTNTSSGAVSYYWDFGNGDTSILQNPPPVLYTNEGATQVTLEVTSNNGCTADDVMTVEVFDTPVADFGFQSVCEGTAATFFDSTTVGYGGPANQWSWSFGDPLTSTSSQQNPNFTYQDSGLYVVTLVVSTPYCTDSVSQTILVEPQPTGAFTMSSDNGCSPLNVSFTNASTGAVNYAWDFGDGNTSNASDPSHVFVHNALTDTVFAIRMIAISAFGCVDTVRDTVEVRGNPVADFSSDAVLDCAPLEVQFTDESTGAISWVWDFDDTTGSNVQNPSKTFDNQTQFITNYLVELVVTAPNGCTDTATENITVYPEPLFNFSIVPDSGCSPLTVNFPVAVGAVLYEWDFGDGNTSSVPSPSHTFINNSTNSQIFQVELVATSPFGCVDTVNGSVKVFPLPTVSFTPPVSAGCGPLPVTFTNTSTGGTTYDWDFGNGQTLTSNNVSVNNTYSNSTNDTAFYYPKLVATTPDGCADSAFNEVRVYRKVESAFSVPSPVCHPYTATFSDLSVNAVDWEWDFDNGLFGFVQNPQTFYQNTGAAPIIFSVELEVESLEGCTDDTVVDVTVLPKPTAAFDIDDSPACHNQSVTISNNSTQNQTNLWQYGANGLVFENNAAAIDTSYLNFTNNPIQFPITLVVENVFGCRDTTQEVMQVFPVVNAQFAALDEGCAPFDVSFNNQSSGGTLYQWSFGDGNNSFLDDPDHTFENTDSADITYSVVLTITSPYGCEDSDTMDILVHPTPLPQFTLNPTAQVFPNATVNFDNLTPTGPWTYAWDFDDGNTSDRKDPNPHKFTTWGEYRVTLTVSSPFCEDTISRLAIIEPPLPVALFDTLTKDCAPISLTFRNQSEYGVSYLWEFGDGATSTAENPSYTYQFPGVYTVRLTVTGPGGDVDFIEVQNAVTVLVQPFANFASAPDAVSIPLEPVIFANYSQDADAFTWLFGDGNSSAEKNPQHLYESAGIYYPMLVAYTNDGCADTAISEVPVTAIIEGSMEIPNAFTPSSSGPRSTIYDPMAFDNEVFFPLLSGVSGSNYTLSIFNRWGELLFETNNANEGWNGYYRGKLCQQDVYVWKISGEYVTGERFTKVGDVTLIQ